jgi:hypothetical protein
MFVRLFRATRHRIIPRRRSIPVRIPQRIDCLATVRVGNRFETDNRRFVFLLIQKYDLPTTAGLFFNCFYTIKLYREISKLGTCSGFLTHLKAILNLWVFVWPQTKHYHWIWNFGICVTPKPNIIIEFGIFDTPLSFSLTSRVRRTPGWELLHWDDLKTKDLWTRDSLLSNL